MMLKTNVSILSLFLASHYAVCEEIKGSVFLDTYIATSENSIVGNERNYLTQPVENNTVSLNLASASFYYTNDVMRVKFSPQIGDSVSINYNAEPNDSLKYLQEGYVGYNLSESTTIDVGVFLSHIGAESWLSKDNINYTRSFIAEFSPYYESGARLSHVFSKELSGQLLLLNGWQNISDERHPAIGTQLSYKMPWATATSNTFIGEESRANRYFHDFVLTSTITDYFTIAGSVDTGYQNHRGETGGFWWGYAIFAKYSVLDALSLNSRIEGYSDGGGTIVTTPDSSDFAANGVSVGIDYNLCSKVIMRGEVRHFWSNNNIFQNNNIYDNEDTIFTISLNIFDERQF